MLKPEQIASVKGRGFLINRGADETAGEALCAAIDEEAAALDGRDLFGF